MSNSKKEAGYIVSDRYKIEKVLGEGAMGVVYRANDERLDRPVALKLIDLGPAGKERDEMEQRVLREAQTPAKMNHFGIVTIYDYGVENDYAFIAMEFVAGRTLEWLIGQHGRIPLLKAVDLMEKFCSALTVAHNLGFIHRDIKPANLMIMQDQSIKVMDFGLAKGTTPSDLQVTKAGMLIGTPKYMSPEQIRGKSLDARTDIYSLGIVFYEMITGKSPYSAKDIYGLLNSVLNEKPPPPSEKYKKIPAIIDKIVLRCIAKDPNHRYEASEKFAADLRNAVNKLLDAKRSRSDSFILTREPISGEHTQTDRVSRSKGTGDSSRRQRRPMESSLISDKDLGIPDLEALDAPRPLSGGKPAPNQVSKDGGAQTIVSTQAIQNRWQEKVDEEVAYQRQNLCAYRYQSLDSIQSHCPEAKFPKSQGGYCVLHDPDIDKTKLNVKKNLEDRVRQKSDMEGSKLSGVQIMDAQLPSGKFHFADFSGANLMGSNLWETDFSHSNLSGARFDRSNCLAGKFENANMSKASFKACRLKRAIMQNANMSMGDFQSSEIREANLKNVTALNADFNRVEFVDSNLEGANLTGSDLRGANFTGANLKKADLSQCKLKGVIFLKATLKGTKFVKADAERADLSNAKLRENNLKQLKAAFARFEKADLWGVDLSFADLRGANLQNADLSRAILTGANLEGANLKGANLRKTDLRKAILNNARLSEADLIEADLRGATLREIEIQGADLTGIQLDIDSFPIDGIPTWNKAIWDQNLKRQLEMKSWGL